MKHTINQQFKGTINGVDITNQKDYHSIVFLIENLETHFDIEINSSDIVEDINSFIQDADYRLEGFSHQDMEIATVDTIMQAKSLQDVEFLANEWDEPYQSWNEMINERLRDVRGYPDIVDAIARSQKASIEKEPMKLESMYSRGLNEKDKEILYDEIEEYYLNNFVEDEEDMEYPFEELYSKEGEDGYYFGLDERIPSIYEKRSTIDLGTWESTDLYYSPKALSTALLSRGESLYNSDLKENDFSQLINLRSHEYNEFIQELSSYLNNNDQGYYTDFNTGSINDSHLNFLGNEIIQDTSIDGYPQDAALYNYLPVAIAKGMATNQITAHAEFLPKLPNILGEHQYESFKKELDHIRREYPNQIKFEVSNGVVVDLTPYQGITYNTEEKDQIFEISNLDLQYKDKIHQYFVQKDREERPIGAIIKNEFRSNDYPESEARKTVKRFETLLTDEEKNNFKETYLSVHDVLNKPNGGLNFTKFDRDTQQMMESYMKLTASGDISSAINKDTMETILQYNMEKNLTKELEQRAEKSLQQESTTPKLSISKPKGNSGLER